MKMTIMVWICSLRWLPSELLAVTGTRLGACERQENEGNAEDVIMNAVTRYNDLLIKLEMVTCY